MDEREPLLKHDKKKSSRDEKEPLLKNDESEHCDKKKSNFKDDIINTILEHFKKQCTNINPKRDLNKNTAYFYNPNDAFGILSKLFGKPKHWYKYKLYIYNALEQISGLKIIKIFANGGVALKDTQKTSKDIIEITEIFCTLCKDYHYYIWRNA
jgi:hypothetical protein